MKRSSDRRHAGEKCILQAEDGNNKATKIQESRAPSTTISLSTSLSRLVSCSEWTGRPKFPLAQSGKERCPWATCINGPRQQLHISIASSRKGIWAGENPSERQNRSGLAQPQVFRLPLFLLAIVSEVSQPAASFTFLPFSASPTYRRLAFEGASGGAEQTFIRLAEAADQICIHPRYGFRYKCWWRNKFLQCIQPRQFYAIVVAANTKIEPEK